ncbi:mucin-2-like [Metopolophium dirhodum]|uniref:mucin-2-like n=1 Tax=Metopolophium dirhodum TaxID=44670 RepID=UPI0029903991|nr:mucin-2-like [Metopolophium dirhodum]
MKFHSGWIVWIWACISLVLCQDGIGTNNATKNSILSEVSKLQNFEVTTSQKPTLTVREEQIEDELSNSATTTEKFMEKRKFIIKPLKENEEYREVFTVRFNETGPTTIRSSLSSTNKIKTSFSSSFTKYDEPEDVTGSDDSDFTTSFDGLTKKGPIDNGERKTRQRLDGLKGVTTNRGKTRFQNEQGTSEIPEILTILRHKKPIRVKPIDQTVKDDVALTSTADDLIDTTTIMDNSEIELQRPKFKKPPLIATHHPNFGTSTEASRRPTIRSNLNLKQKIISSTIKTKPFEQDVTEPEIIIANNNTAEVGSPSVQLNKMRPIKVIAPKGSAAQQPIPPTATAWALASLKAPNNTNRIFKKPLNVTSVQESVTKIKPFITWSTRLQKTNEDNLNTTSTSNGALATGESNETFTGTPETYVLSNESSTTNRLTPEITSTESLIHTISMLSTSHIPNINDSTMNVFGGDTDQNKYEVYGSQRPDVENTTTVIETLRPSSSTTPTESQNSNLLLVTSYKSIFENNNTSDVQQNIFTSSEIPVSQIAPKIEVTKVEFTTLSTDPSNILHNNGVTINTEDVGDHKLPVVQTSTEIFSKAPGLLFDYSEYHDSNKMPTTTGVQSSNSDIEFSISHDDIDLNNQNHSTTTEHYIESIKTKLDDKITESMDNHDSLEMIDFTHMFSSENPISNSTAGTEVVTATSEKTSSELSQLPSNDISNTSQAPSWSNTPDPSFIDFEYNSTDSHDDAVDDGQKTFESSSLSPMAVNEPTSESDISENDVPIVTSLLSSTTSTTSTTTTTTTTSTTTTTTTPKPTTTTTTTLRPTTTTTTTLKPIATTSTTTPIPTTTQRITTTTSPPIVIEITTPTTSTTVKPSSTQSSITTSPNKQTTTTIKPNSITSRPKPAVVDSSTTTFGPNEPIIQSYLNVMINSTMADICENKDELKDAIIKLFESGSESVHSKNQIRFLNVFEKHCFHPNDEKSPVEVEFYLLNSNGDYNTFMNEEFLNLLHNHPFDYKSNVIRAKFMKRAIEIDVDKDETENPRVKAAIYLSCIAGVCTLLVLILIIVRKRQKRFNYGQRCTPVSLDDYSMDNISVFNSFRRKGARRASKRSYGNPAFDESSACSHVLNFAGLVSFSEDRPAIDEEFSNVPVITVKPDELPPGAETKNRYANVIPMPETRVLLNPRGSGLNSDYINANFVKGYKGADKFYIACQAPMQSTVPDFWQMIWDQNTRVIIMVTSLTEKGVERCADYLPPSEVLDCHRLFGDYQITLKKREVKEKFIISNLQLKNLETNLWRDVTHLWYGGWPVQGVPSDPGAMLAFVMEARSHMKTNSGPHVVHCSPGTGRTGTVIACDMAIRDFELTRTVDVPKTVYAVRRCRAGAVQTRDQYALIYKVVNLYASKLSGGVLDSF